MSFLENFDKDEGVIKQIILPAINQINSDETSNEIKNKSYDSFSNITGDYLKKLILQFEILKLPPIDSFPLNDFPNIYNLYLSIFKSELQSGIQDSFINFINNLFKLFSDPSSEFILGMLSLTITIQLQSGIPYLLTNEDLNGIILGLYDIITNPNNEQKLTKEKIDEINSYISFFLLKYLASRYVLIITPPTGIPLPPINLLGLIVPYTIVQINQEFINKVNQLLND